MRHILLSGCQWSNGKSFLQHMIAGHAEFVISAGLDRHTEATGDFPILFCTRSSQRNLLIW